MGRSVLVTGGNRGIGLAIAQNLSAQGHSVAVTHRGSGAPEGLFAVKADVTDTEQVDAAFTLIEEHQGPVEVLVSNAGIIDDTLLMRMNEDQFTRVLDTNLTAAYRVSKRASRGMLRGKWGRLVFVSSIVAYVGGAGQVNYAASKAGLIGLGRSLARELGPRNITSNVVTPGFVRSDMTDALDGALHAKALENIPAGRAAEPADVAAAIRFLTSEEAGYVNGVVLPVDGGLGMGY